MTEAKRHLSNDDLLSFIDYAFHKMEIPSKKFRLQDAGVKEKIMKLFGDYFRNVSPRIQGKKPLYARLLSDYFEGYTHPNVMANFS